MFLLVLTQIVNYVNKFDKTNIAVKYGDITQIPADAILTAINSASASWFGGIDGAIMRVAGNHYHNKAAAAGNLSDLTTIVATGNRSAHAGYFDDVVFVVDDLKSPLDEVLYKGLVAASGEGYKRILIPTIRMGVMAGVKESPEEAIQKMGEGLQKFMEDYAHKTRIEEIIFVVYGDPHLVEKLGSCLRSLK